MRSTEHGDDRHSAGAGGLDGRLLHDAVRLVLRAVVAAARVAQQGWAAKTPAQRAEVLFEFARLVNRDAEALMDMVQAESGKARQYAQEEVVDTALTARHYANSGPAALAEHKVKGMIPGATSVRVRYQPKGVVGVVSPWNFPVGMVFVPMAGILAAGNRAMIKPSEFTPRIAATWARVKDSTGATVFDCSVTATGGGGVITLNTTSIVSGSPVSITSGTLTVPTA